jgi:hypothetical protein
MLSYGLIFLETRWMPEYCKEPTSSGILLYLSYNLVFFYNKMEPKYHDPVWVGFLLSVRSGG